MNMFENIKKSNRQIALIDTDNTEVTFSQIANFSIKIRDIVDKNSLFLLASNYSAESISIYVYLIKNSIPTILINSDFKEQIKSAIKFFKPNYIYSNSKIIDSKYSINKNFNGFFYTKKKRLIHSKINKKISLILATSGSTSSNKYVLLSKENLFSNAKGIIHSLKLDKFNSTTITTLPFSYSYGLSIINTHLITNNKIVLNNHSILEKFFWKRLNDNNVNNFGAVPFLYSILIKIGFENLIHKKFKYLTQAGGALDKKQKKILVKKCLDNKIDLYFMYGQTENTARISIQKFRKTKNLDSVGKPIHGTKIKIKKINYEDKQGEIIIYGTSLFLGYAFSLSDLSKKLSPIKSFSTGDLGYIDKTGDLYITGRKSDIIKINGIRYSLNDIEDFIDQNQKIICIGDVDVLVIFHINLKKIEIIKKEIIKKFRIDKNKIIIIPLNQIPLNQNKKTNYNELRKIYKEFRN